MKKIYVFILFGILFNIATFFIASTGWFPNTLYGDAVTDINLDDPESLSSGEDVFLRMVKNDVGANLIANLLKIDATASFGILLAGFITSAAIIGWFSKGSGTTIVGMSIIAYLFYTMFVNSKNFFNSLLSDLPAQTNYIVVMVIFCLLFSFIVLMADFSSGQKSST